MKEYLAIILIILSLTACGPNINIPISPQSGLYQVDSQTKVMINKPLDIDKRTSLLVLKDSGPGVISNYAGVPAIKFHREKISNLNYFEQILTLTEFEESIIQNNLTDKIPSISNNIGLSNAAKHYKSFLLLEIAMLNSGLGPQQITLTDPLTLEVHLKASSQSPAVDLSFWGSYLPERYSLYNALINYLKENSKTFHK